MQFDSRWNKGSQSILHSLKPIFCNEDHSANPTVSFFSEGEWKLAQPIGANSVLQPSIALQNTTSQDHQDN